MTLHRNIIRLLCRNRIIFCRSIYSINTYYEIFSHKNYRFEPLVPNIFFSSTRLKISSNASNKRCWHCGFESNPQKDLFCKKCQTIQRAENSSNYFDVIGVEINYELNLKELTQKYRRLQTLLHPDKYTNKSAEEKDISEERSALVNEAYKTLQNPLLRGLHLLYLNGESIETDVKPDSQFLAEVMLKYEEVEEATDLNDIQQLYDDSNETIHQLSTQVLKAFIGNDIPAAKVYLSKMKYHDSINKQLRDKLRNKVVM